MGVFSRQKLEDGGDIDALKGKVGDPKPAKGEESSRAGE